MTDPASPHAVMNLFEPPLKEGQARDPVCGMAVDKATAKHVAAHAGADYYFCCAGCRQKFLADPETFLNKRAIDPVCGMKVDVASAKHRTERDGKTYYFCSGRCREKFEADPARFVGAEPAKPEAPPPPGTTYTCPMHPEIRQIGPGTCPICGMALEPEVASLDSGPNVELLDMTRRFWI